MDSQRSLDNFVFYGLKPALDVSGAIINRSYFNLLNKNEEKLPLSSRIPAIARFVGATAVAIPVGLVTLIGGSAFGAAATGYEYTRRNK